MEPDDQPCGALFRDIRRAERVLLVEERLLNRAQNRIEGNIAHGIHRIGPRLLGRRSIGIMRLGITTAAERRELHSANQRVQERRIRLANVRAKLAQRREILIRFMDHVSMLERIRDETGWNGLVVVNDAHATPQLLHALMGAHFNYEVRLDTAHL